LQVEVSQLVKEINDLSIIEDNVSSNCLYWLYAPYCKKLWIRGWDQQFRLDSITIPYKLTR
jgi:hypothetical protein